MLPYEVTLQEPGTFPYVPLSFTGLQGSLSPYFKEDMTFRFQ